MRLRMYRRDAKHSRRNNFKTATEHSSAEVLQRHQKFADKCVKLLYI